MEPTRPPGLDGCRIHPEQYAQARKMCFDSCFEEEVEESEEKFVEAIEWAMSPEGMVTKTYTDGLGRATQSLVSALDELELEEFAEHLRVEEGIKVGKETLEDVKAELCHPFKDTRGSALQRGAERGPLEPERLFELLTSETEATLRPGSLVAMNSHVAHNVGSVGADRPDRLALSTFFFRRSALTGTVQPPAWLPPVWALKAELGHLPPGLTRLLRNALDAELTGGRCTMQQP